MNFVGKIHAIIKNTDLLITVLEKILLILCIFVVASIVVLFIIAFLGLKKEKTR